MKLFWFNKKFNVYIYGWKREAKSLKSLKKFILKRPVKMSIWIRWFQSFTNWFAELLPISYWFLPFGKFGKIVLIYMTNQYNFTEWSIFRIIISISCFFTKRLNEFSFNNQYQSICDWFYRFLPLVKKCDESHDQSAKIMPKALNGRKFWFRPVLP